MKRFLCMVAILFSLGSLESAVAQQPYLLAMPTAETLGEGGYTTRISVFRYEQAISKSLEEVVVGDFFKERHDVELTADKLLFPVSLTVGIGEALDLTLGGTATSGEMAKSITDYYEVGDTTRERVYSQPMFEGMLGLKYNIKPDIGDGLPGIAIGGGLHVGYTADDEPRADKTFLDDTPADGFPFAAARLFVVGSQRLSDLAHVHASLGGLMAPRRFRFALQVGGDLAMTEELYLAADYTTVDLVNGVEFESLFSFGLRYELGTARHFHAGLSTVDFGDLGLVFGFSVGGEKTPLAAPVAPTPAGPADLF